MRELNIRLHDGSTLLNRHRDNAGSPIGNLSGQKDLTKMDPMSMCELGFRLAPKSWQTKQPRIRRADLRHSYR